MASILDNHAPKTPQERMDEMIGLKDAKQSLKDILYGLDMIEDYKRNGLEPPAPRRLNLLLLANPGTGKNLLIQIFRDMLLERKFVNEKFTRLSPNDGEITDVEKLFTDNKGGVIFIDEFHQMHQKDELKDALRAMMPYLDAPEHERTVFIGAGYPNEVESMVDDKTVDPGLTRRFGKELRIKLADFTVEELGQILDITVKNQPNPWPALPPQIREQALVTILRRQKWGRSYNARGVVKFFESAKTKQQQRLLKIAQNGGPRPDKAALTSFVLEDVMPPPPLITLERFWKDTSEKFSGFVEVLQQLQDIQIVIEDQRQRKITHKTPYTFFLKGPPGVGKTTIAREVINKFFCALDIIPTFDLAPDPIKGGTGAQLQAQYVGQSAAKVKKIFDEGFGKTVFIDEFSGFLNSHYRREILLSMLSCLDDYPEKFIFVAADYTENFNRMVSLDRGLSRFCRYVIHIPRWDANLSTTVFLNMMMKEYKRNLDEHKDYILKCMQPLTETFWEDENTGASYGFASGVTCSRLASKVDRLLTRTHSNMTAKEAIEIEFDIEHKRLKTVFNNDDA